MFEEKKFEEKLETIIEKYGRKNNKDEIDYENIEEYYYFTYQKCEEQQKNCVKTDRDQDEQIPYNKFKIIIYDPNIISYIIDTNIDSDIYSDEPELDVANIYYGIHNLRIKYDQNKDENKIMIRFLNFVEELFGDKYTKMDNMIANGLINFESLWYYFDKTDQILMVKLFDEDICFRQKSFLYDYDDDDNEILELVGEIVCPIENNLKVCQYSFEHPKFVGIKKIDTLTIKFLNENDKDIYNKYADDIMKYYDNIAHMIMDGNMYFRNVQSYGISSSFKKEKVMIDYEGFKKYSSSIINVIPQHTLEVENLTEKDKLIIFPFSCCYSLGVEKRWGLVHIKYLKPVVYNKDAFDYLVLEESKKSIIKCLINNIDHENKYSDFIDGKGNGLVILLYGLPGTGKTLTAEATSHHLEKPIYNLNVGDLGTDPEHMEKIIYVALDYVKRWDAIMLIDEVDMFLEERETNMIIRNAMVGIFLKLLEYHNGIIFLTTNRLESLDPAVKSRLNLMLSYESLNKNRRKQVWKSMFSKWNIEIEDHYFDKLSSYELNGREIRNYMRTVFAIHNEEKLELTGRNILNSLERCFKLTEEFSKNIKPSLYT